jgi:hypothetical protein
MTISRWAKGAAALLLAVLVAAPATAAEGGEKRKVKRADREWLVLKERADGWRATSAGASLEVRRDGAGLVLQGRGRWTARRSGDRIRIAGPADRPFATIDAGLEKTKIAFEGGTPPLTLKRKEDPDKIKVKSGDRDVGKLKLYPEKGKVKAKGEGEEELCETKGEKLAPSLAVCFLQTLPEEELLVLFTVLELELR